jgi:hypothetical protein
MNLFSMKKWMFGLVLTLGGILTMPAYAWPEVDHMNMCGSATKAVKGGFTTWADYDRYVAKRGKAYYLRTNCPNTVAPVKAKKVAYKKVAKKAPVYAKTVSIKAIVKRATYNEKLDCARVDRMNGFNHAGTHKIAGPKSARIAKSSKAKIFRSRVKYDEKADCARVDRANGF